MHELKYVIRWLNDKVHLFIVITNSIFEFSFFHRGNFETNYFKARFTRNNTFFVCQTRIKICTTYGC